MVTAASYEYGNTFLIVCGLLNMLVALDAFDVALGPEVMTSHCWSDDRCSRSSSRSSSPPSPTTNRARQAMFGAAHLRRIRPAPASALGWLMYPLPL